jgi:hypothetical protein
VIITQMQYIYPSFTQQISTIGILSSAYSMICANIVGKLNSSITARFEVHLDYILSCGTSRASLPKASASTVFYALSPSSSYENIDASIIDESNVVS